MNLHILQDLKTPSKLSLYGTSQIEIYKAHPYYAQTNVWIYLLYSRWHCIIDRKLPMVVKNITDYMAHQWKFRIHKTYNTNLNYHYMAYHE